MSRILDIAIACGASVVVTAKGASVTWPESGEHLDTSVSEGLPFDDAVANLELALGRRGVDVVRGGRDA